MEPEGNAAERVLIVGTGALATLFAARLGASGCSVTMLGTWTEGLRVLNAEGARLIDLDGNEIRIPVLATGDPSDCAGSRFALVLVKSWQTTRAADQLQMCMAKDGLVVTLQNGLGNREILAERLGAARVALGSTTTGATLLGPGLAKAGGEGTLSIEEHQRLAPLKQALGRARFRLEFVPDARGLIWSKLVVNSAINPLTAILRVPNGQLLERPSARRLLHALARETAAVAQAEHIQLASPDPVDMVEAVARGTAANHSSMFQDIQRGAPTEIDAICGAVTRAGMQHSIPTPLNSTCWQLVQALAEAPSRAAQSWS
jgi:2-dehydropantoate 2-reductase